MEEKPYEEKVASEPQAAAMDETPPWLSPDMRNFEDQNLVPMFEKTPEGQKWLGEMAEKVCRDKTDDEKTCKPRWDNIADGLRLYFGFADEFQHGPAKGERKPCLPIAAKIVNRIYSRTVGVVLSTEPVAVPTGDDDHERSIRVGQHISWEKRYKHPEWKPGMQSSILQWILCGSMNRYVGWDPLERKKRIRQLSVRDVVFPYSDKDTTPDLREVERYTIIDRWSKQKLLRVAKLGHFHGIKELFDENAEKKAKPVERKTGDSDPIQDVLDEAQGFEPNTTRKGQIYELFERHSWESLPGDPEETPRRLAITVEASTKRVLRVVIMEMVDPADRTRFENETRLRQIEFANRTAEYQQAAAMGQPIMGEPPVQQPVKPPLMLAIYPLIHYPFHPNPEGIMGLGVLDFVGRMNELANELAGEDLVGQRLANASGSSGFVSEDLQLEKGELEVEYGKYTQVQSPPGSPVSDAFMTMNFERPKGNLLGWLERVDQDAQAVMSSSDAQSGVPGPSHETAAAAKIRAYQGMTSITSAIEAFLVSLAVEYRQYARINSVYMNDVEYFFVTEPDPLNPGSRKQKKVQISRNDYEADFDITFDADARLEVDPGIGQSAIDAYQLIMADPDVQGDMNLRMAARKKALKALKAGDLAAMLPDEVPPPPPPQPMSQEEETAGFMTEQDHPVLDDDDHNDHMAKMNEFEASGQYNELSATGRQLYDRHKRTHKAKMYLQASQLLQGGFPGPGTTQPQPEELGVGPGLV